MDCYRKLASQSSVYAQVYCCVWSGIREQQLPLQLFWERNLLGFIQSMIPLQGDFSQNTCLCNPWYQMPFLLSHFIRICMEPVMAPLVREQVLYWIVLEC